jgi:hypothetical protein
LQRLYDLKVGALRRQALMPIEVLSEERTHTPYKRRIASPYIGVRALRKLLAFLDRLLLLGGKEYAPAFVGVPLVHHPPLLRISFEFSAGHCPFLSPVTA